jgi:hypothetical protein
VVIKMNAGTNAKMRSYLKAGLLVLLLCAAAVETVAAEEPAIDPPGRVARLSYIDGDVSLAPAGSEEWTDAILNRPLTSGDKLWVENRGRAELQVGAASIFLDEATGFSFLELDDDVMQMSLTEGVATLRVRRRSESETIQIDTPNGAVTLLHPGEYTIEVDPDRGETIVRTRTGDAEMFAGEDVHVVRAGEAVVFTGLDKLQMHTSALGPRTAFEQWANDRDRSEQQSESSRYVSSDVVGYEDLDGNGEWISEREYGYVWRPRYVAHDWAPYRFGRWVWVSPWGFTWIDDARWGFAPFHYGRWTQVRSRWCWVPGPRHLRPVYSPAFVAWIDGPHSRYGWYPLGPREIYVPGYRHSQRYIRLVNHANTLDLNDRHFSNLNSRRGRPFDYRYRNHPDAITVVDRDRFLSGRPLGDSRLRMHSDETRGWRYDSRPPALVPNRDSLLGGNPRSMPPQWRDSDRNRALFPRHQLPNRIPFDAERRAIEANGGRPPSRSQLLGRIPRERDAERGRTWRDGTQPSRVLSTDDSSRAAGSDAPRALHQLGDVHTRTPSGRLHSGDRDDRPAAIDSVARDREDRDQRRNTWREAGLSNPRPEVSGSRSWNSGSGDRMRERVQREPPPMRRPETLDNRPAVRGSRPTLRRDEPMRTDRGGRAGATPRAETSQPRQVTGGQRPMRVNER